MSFSEVTTCLYKNFKENFKIQLFVPCISAYSTYEKKRKQKK